MPTYAYRCTNPECAHTFDAVQAFTDDALTECPVCGQPVRKVFGAVGVVFKGSGFYRTDSRPKEGSPSGSSSSSSESKGSGSGGSSEKSGDSGSGSSSPKTESSSSTTPAKAAASSSSSSSTGSGSSS